MKKFNLFAICVMACLFAGCEPKVTEQKPTVLTLNVTDVTTTSAIVNCDVVNDGGASVTDRGVAYDTYPNPKASGTRCKAGTGTGKYSCTLTELEDNKKYYVRAYAKNDIGIEYGEEVSFTTIKELRTPKVSTGNIMDIIAVSAVVTGSIIDDGGKTITECGIVYNTSENPTISNYKVIGENNTGYFQCQLTGLQEQTTYYVRAYALNEKGVAYGEEKYFTTKTLDVPIVNTVAVTDISFTSAIVYGNISDACGGNIIERGVVYGTSQEPTTADDKIESGIGIGDFRCNLANLQECTMYYARAYAINEKGTSYGKDIIFRTKHSNGFSVSDSTQVIFSSGNLQYHITDKIWRFAENQTDFLGESQIDDYYDRLSGWIDWLRWDWFTSNPDSFVDWGTNQIGNDAPNTWRTLKESEWEYLLHTRANNSSLIGVAQVNGVNGLILLPDNWSCPQDITFKSGFGQADPHNKNYSQYQAFTIAQWSKLEIAGAVFLPAAGYYDLYQSFSAWVGEYGFYWSATGAKAVNKPIDGALFLNFNIERTAWEYEEQLGMGYSVRLVKDL